MSSVMTPDVMVDFTGRHDDFAECHPSLRRMSSIPLPHVIDPFAEPIQL